MKRSVRDRSRRTSINLFNMSSATGLGGWVSAALWISFHICSWIFSDWAVVLRGFGVRGVVVEERDLRSQVHILAKQLLERFARRIRQETALQIKSSERVGVVHDQLTADVVTTGRHGEGKGNQQGEQPQQRSHDRTYGPAAGLIRLRVLAPTGKTANFPRQHGRSRGARRQSRSNSARKASWSSSPSCIRHSDHALASPAAKVAAATALKTSSAPLEAIKTLTLRFAPRCRFWKSRSTSLAPELRLCADW